MSAESHTLMEGKLHVYRRENSGFWQCATYMGGRNHRTTTKQTSLALAMDYAREWYLDRAADERLRKRGILVSEGVAVAAPEAVSGSPIEVFRATKVPKGGPTFREAAAIFI